LRELSRRKQKEREEKEKKKAEEVIQAPIKVCVRWMDRGAE